MSNKERSFSNFTIKLYQKLQRISEHYARGKKDLATKIQSFIGLFRISWLKVETLLTSMVRVENQYMARNSLTRTLN